MTDIFFKMNNNIDASMEASPYSKCELIQLPGLSDKKSRGSQNAKSVLLPHYSRKEKSFLPAPVSFNPDPSAGSFLPVSGHPGAVCSFDPMSRNPHMSAMRPFPVAIHPNCMRMRWCWFHLYLKFRWRHRNIHGRRTTKKEKREHQDHTNE